MVDKNHLEYFKKLMEGHSGISFSAYLRKHEDSLREQLPRAQFLRLKFNSVDEIQKILNAAEISYQPSQSAINTEKYLMNFHPDVLDENGKIKKSHKDEMFDGAIRLFDEDKLAAERALHKFIGYPKNINTKKSISRMEDVEGLAEVEFEYGSKELGLFLLKTLASIERQFSDADEIVIRAKQSLLAYTGNSK
ncbi:hypothetical protein [Acidovorax sp. NCPPB 3576]|uniref:hypothetical protein n=1 Tax=Acidovorax sp. NCPPB 3576 TaxID=2940488 RepID=UPI00234B6F19|nr:hypothetical protein [Acidovorax sp. NCPPB 3576]WCM86864.1 hypothetical protein M5C98_15945 [Acidovorax sp. NCPPB 3576]